MASCHQSSTSSIVEISGLIVKHLEQQVVLSGTCVQEATYIKKGAKEIHDFLIPKICIVHPKLPTHLCK
jgi:hypothetical protein